jgi:hypothetical protein
VKVIGGNDILEPSDFEKNLSFKRLSNYRKITYIIPEMESHYFLMVMKIEV